MSKPTSTRSSRCWWWPHVSLAVQLILIALLPALLVTAALVVVLTQQHLSAVEQLTRSNAQAVALQVAAWAQAPVSALDRRALQRIALVGASLPEVQQVLIWSPEGELLARSDNLDFRRTPGLSVTAPIIVEGEPAGGQVHVDVSTQVLLAAQQTSRNTVLAAFLVCALCVALAAAWAVARVSAPVRHIVRAMEQLGAGEHAQVRLEGATEVQRLQRGFNRAAAALTESRLLMESRIAAATAELERKNEQIERASQAKTRLLAAASHDLRQPLHALTLFSEGLANGETDPQRLQRIAHVRECVASLDYLFSELLNISQIDAGVLKPQLAEFALDRLFDDISRNFRPIAEVQALRLVVRCTDHWVRTDYAMLSRVIGNLVSNALRHTVSGGVLLAARRRGEQIQIDVIDTGVGIALEHQESVFEEFFRLDNPHARTSGSMGLGLATVRRLGQLLNMPVQLRSQPGRGTGIRLLVPRCTPPGLPMPALDWPASAPAPLEPAGCLTGRRILVIDDETTILLGLQMVLSSWGADVVIAEDGASALRHARDASAAFDVVISDLLLRRGENGLSVMRKIQHHTGAINARTALLLVTGETKPERLQEVAASGVPVLYKPVPPAALRRAIEAGLAMGADAEVEEMAEVA